MKVAFKMRKGKELIMEEGKMRWRIYSQLSFLFDIGSVEEGAFSLLPHPQSTLLTSFFQREGELFKHSKHRANTNYILLGGRVSKPMFPRLYTVPLLQCAGSGPGHSLFYLRASASIASGLFQTFPSLSSDRSMQAFLRFQA